MNWYSFAELEKKTGLSRNSIKWQCQQGKFPNAKQVTNETGRPEWKIPETDIEDLLEDALFIQESYSAEELRKLLDCTTHRIEVMISDGIFKQCKKINRKWYIKKKEVDIYLQNIVFSLGDYYSSEEIVAILNIPKSTFQKTFNKGLFDETLTHFGEKFVLKKEIDNYKKVINTFYSTKDASEILNMRLSSIGPKCKNGDFEGSIKLPFSNSWFIPQETVIRYKEKMEQEKVDIKSEYDVFPLLTKNIDVKYAPRTYELFSLYIRNKLKRSRKNNKIDLARSLTSSYKKINSILVKELFLYNDEEIPLIFSNPDIGSNASKELSLFLKFLKSKNDIDCSFKNEYSVQSKKKNQNEQQDIYSKELWTEYYYFLTDIDEHIENAIKDQRYACTWLFLMLHLVLAWRPIDLLKMPSIRLEEVDIYSFDWFDNNKFTFSQGEKIINHVRHLSEFIETNKTGANAHFVTTVDLVIPISISFILCELHKRKNNESALFSPFKNAKPKKEREIKKVFKDREELYDFTSLKANRTLMTYGFEHASKTKGKAYLAYELSSNMRSHKKGRNEISSTTEQYILSTNNDGSIDDVSFQLFRRGMFGWLYKKMIDVAFDKEIESSSVEEETQFIENIQKTYSPSDIDNISKFMQQQLERKETIVQELLSMDKEELKIKIRKLVRKEMPAKQKNAQCLKSGNCPFTTSETCTGCDYLIPEFYILYSVREELDSLLKQISNTSDKEKMKRIKLTHFIYRILSLLQELKKEYQFFDGEIIENFFDLKRLKQTLNDLQQTKFEFINNERD